MKILVVEDQLPLRELLAHMLRNQGVGIEVLEAGSLDEARELLPQADAVLCDGSFPSHAGSAYEPLVTADGNWAPVQMAAAKLSIPFVMLSGLFVLVERLRSKGTEAFEKPGGAYEAVRRVAALARIHAATQARVPVLPIEDPRIQQADIENSRPDESDEETEKPRAWWKKFSGQ